MSESDFVRVRLENGVEMSIPASHAESAELTPLDKPALAPSGQPAAPKSRVAKGAAVQPTTSTRETRPVSESLKEG